MPFPKDHTQEHYDCFRCALACYLDIEPEKVPYFDPDESNPDFEKQYEDWVREATGNELIYIENVETLMESGIRWIASVNSLTHRDWEHSIVMDGDKLHYDPGRTKRKKKPHKFYWGAIIGRYEDGKLYSLY